MGKNDFCFFQTAVTGNRTPISGVKGSGANHYPRALALPHCKGKHINGRSPLTQNVGFQMNQKELTLYASFEYICYRSAVIINSLLSQCEDRV